ncbi:uncharacterized protein LOC144656878 [Oculina patagonica]
MPLKESYVVWNNKGGVGKTTLTFHMATRYASRNPGVRVLVIDLCPQANVSMALLNSPGQQGSEHLTSLYRENKTISFYLQSSTETGPVVDANRFVIRVCDYNDQVPANLFLLCGDMYLELVGRHLEHLRSGYARPRHNPWVIVTSSVRSFIEGSEGKVTGVTQDGDEMVEWVVFIDTNPAFTVYTEIALAAAKKLIIPINADDFSVEAVRAMLDLVYDIQTEGEREEPENFEAYRQYMFNNKATQFGLRRPQIHLLINNRVTQRNTRATTAFDAMGQENLKVLFEAYQQHQEDKLCFSPREGEIANKEVFKEQYFKDIQDFHSTAIISLHTGCPLASLAGLVGKVQISEEVKVKIEKKVLPPYVEALDRLVKKL